MVSGCLYDAEGRRVDLSQRRADISGKMALCLDPASIDLTEPSVAGATRLRGRTLYLGNFMNHYGHFITESLSRLWSSERMDEFDHVVSYASNANNGEVRPRHFHRYILGLRGLALSRLEILRLPVRFDEVTVPEQLWSINDHVNSHVRALYAEIRKRHVLPDPTGRIFLSRDVSSDSRLTNAAQVEAVFASFGFAVHRPETLDIARQLRLYANCEVLAGLSGSGMHNCLFSRPGTLTIEVGDLRAKQRSTRMQQMADQLASTNAVFVPFVGEPGGRTDIGALTDRLSQILGERPSSARVILLKLRRAANLRAHFKTLRRRIMRRQ